MNNKKLLYTFIPIVSFTIGLFFEYLTGYFNLQNLWQQLSFIILLIILVLSLIIIIKIAIDIDNSLTKEVNKLKHINTAIDEFSTLKSVKVYTSSINMNEDISEDLKTLENHYSTAAELINNAKSSIVIYNYIDSHPTVKSILRNIKNSINGEDKYNNCCNAIEQYYKAIESKVSSGDIEYTRVTMLPLSYPPTSDININFNEIENTKLSTTLNEFTIDHLKTMNGIYKKRPNKVHLKILPFAVSNYSFAIIDNKNMIIELDRYNLAGYSFPHHILNFKDKLGGEVIKEFKDISEIYLHKTFELNIDRDLKRTIGNIKNTELNLKKDRMKLCIEKYA